MTLAYSPPPQGFVVIRSWLLRSLAELAVVRAELHRTLTGVPLPPDRSLAETPEKIVLVTSELATNALRHGTPPVTVRLLSDGREFVVDVVDHSPDAEPVIAGSRAPGAGGFGLVLARRVSRDVGWYRSGTDEKHVWARFDVPSFRGGADALDARGGADMRSAVSSAS